MCSSVLRLRAVRRSDAGRYRCWLRVGAALLPSDVGTLSVHGLPYFVLEPQDVEVGVATPFNLSCGARGPPDPIQLRWLRDGTPLPEPPPGNDNGDPPSILLVPGLNRSATFSCEARNARGVSTSRSAVVTVVPQRPTRVGLTEVGQRWMELSWEAGSSGETPTGVCSVQAVSELPAVGAAVLEVPVAVPPFSHRVGALQPHTPYRLRVACGAPGGPTSQWSQWVRAATAEGGRGPAVPP